MTTFNWTIAWMEASTQVIDGYTDVILTAQWSCSASETTGTPAKTYNVQTNDVCKFSVPAEGGSFTPYDQLTQDQVLGWCWADGVDKAEVEQGLQFQIDAQANPTQAQVPLPWQPNPTPVPTDVVPAA